VITKDMNDSYQYIYAIAHIICNRLVHSRLFTRMQPNHNINRPVGNKSTMWESLNTV